MGEHRHEVHKSSVHRCRHSHPGYSDSRPPAIINSYSFYDALIDLFGDVPEGSLILDGEVYYDVDPAPEE